jgi:hypothetical protein
MFFTKNRKKNSLALSSGFWVLSAGQRMDGVETTDGHGSTAILGDS